MRIAVATLGTRGDVQPYLALAKRLQARGHDVKLAAPENFGSWIEHHGVRFHSLGVDMEALLRSEEVRDVLTGNWTRLFSLWRSVVIPMIQASVEATAAATRDADVVIFHPKAAGVPDVVERTGALAILAAPLPMMPTADFPLWVSRRQFPRAINRATWEALRVARAPYSRMLNRWRRTSLGLGKGRSFSPIGALHNGRAMHLCAVSPSVLPKPSDWGEDSHMVGYWFLDEGAGTPLQPSLESFLNAGDAPLYLGLGSMATKEPLHLAERFSEASRAASSRLIVARGWGGLENVPKSDHVFVLDEAPHDALFPRVHAVIHHGGAGTTAAGLRAGKPTLIFPQIGDQSFWGKRVQSLGCGPPPLHKRDVASNTLVDRIRDLVHNESYKLGARGIASAIANEDGLGEAIRRIERAAGLHFSLV